MTASNYLHDDGFNYPTCRRNETDAMLHAAMTCKVGVAVVSESFVRKTWPLLELAIFGARLRRRKQLLQRPEHSVFVGDDYLDLHFTLIPDFYNPVKGRMWIDELYDELQPLPITEWPAGIRHEERLDLEHARKVMKTAVMRLHHPSIAPSETKEPSNDPLDELFGNVFPKIHLNSEKARSSFKISRVPTPYCCLSLDEVEAPLSGP